MARVRLSVALLLPQRVADEVDGIRRSFGVDLSYIPPHVTVVPPVNVAEDQLASALATLRAAASGLSAPLQMTLGPFDTFLPRNPVLYLTVGGDLTGLGRLRTNCLAGPFERPDPRPYVPHVTITRGLSPEDDGAVRRLMGRYSQDFEVDRLHLLAQVSDTDRGRRWVPTADVAFEPRRVIGTGGIAIEVTVSTLADPATRRFLVEHDLAGPVPTTYWRSIVVTGRMSGEVAGVAWGSQAGRSAILDRVFVAPQAREHGLAGHLIATLEHDVARHGGAVVESRVAADDAGARLLVGRGWTERPGPGGPRLWRALGPDDPDQSNSIEA